MAPTMQITSDSPSKRSAPSPGNSRVITIVCAVIGGVLLLLILCAIFVCIVRRRHLRRRTEVANANDTKNEIANRRFSYKSTPSNAPLLEVDPYWRSSEDGDHLVSSHDRAYNHSMNEMRFYDQQPATFSLDSTPFMSEALSPTHSIRSSLPRLAIPERTSLLTTNEYAFPALHASAEPIVPASPSSASSDGSESLYSQPSASVHTPHIYSFPPLPMAPLQRLPTRLIVASSEERDTTPKRSETAMVAKMLKKRADRNPNKPVRSASQVSHIERAGSIKPAESLVDSNSSGSYRRRLAKKPRQVNTASMESLAEVLDSAVASIAGTTPTLHTPPSQFPILPAQPPPTLRIINHLERPSPPHNLVALTPIPLHDRGINV